MTQTSPPTTAAERRALRPWRNAVFVIFFASGVALASWLSRVPAVRDGLNLSMTDVGLVIFGLSGGSVLGLIAAPPLLARLGARHGMVLGMTGAALGLLFVGAGTSLAPSVALVVIGLVLLGLGMGSVDVIMNVEGAAAERAIGRTLMPLMHACFSFGTVAGALGGALASALEVKIVWHLAAIALLVLGMVVVSVRSIPARADLGDATPAPATTTGSVASAGAAPPTWRSRLRSSLSVWRDTRLLLIGLIVLGMTFAEGAAGDWIALAAIDGHGSTNTQGAIVFGVFVAAMTVGRVLGGPVLDRFGRVAVLRACAAIGVVGLLLFILGPAPWLILLGTVLWGLGASLGFPVGMSAAADDARFAAARVSAVAMIGYFAFLVGPPVLGLLSDAWGILNALLVILALMVLAGLAAPAARGRPARG